MIAIRQLVTDNTSEIRKLATRVFYVTDLLPRKIKAGRPKQAADNNILVLQFKEGNFKPRHINRLLKNYTVWKKEILVYSP